MVYTPTPPPLQLTFFSAGFRQVSARFPPGFRRVPPGSAGFRRVVLGSAGFRQVPPSRVAPGSVRPGFVALPPTRFLLWTRLQFAFFLPPFRLWGYPCCCTPPRFNQVSAMIVRSSWQASARLAAIKDALFTNARTLPKSACGIIMKNPQ